MMHDPTSNLTSIVRGKSWLMANMTGFGAASPKWYGRSDPVFAVQMAAFGDHLWIDANGRHSADPYLSQIPDEVKASAAAGHTRILLDTSNEGQPLFPDWMHILHTDLDRHGIPSGACVYLQQNRALAGPYLEWAIAAGTDPMRVMVYDFFARRIVGNLASEPLRLDLARGAREKRFISLNFTPRPNRTALVSWLLARGYDRDGLISFGGFDHHKWESKRPEVYPSFPQREVVDRGLQILLDRGRIVLDLTEGESPDFKLGAEDMYDQTYFSLVTESDVSNGDLVRITEKIIKPLAMGHPVVLLGNPFSLELLRQFGFRTFDGFVDESYDQICDPTQRISAVLDQVDTLCNLPMSELHKRYWSLEETLRFNVLHARRLLNEQFRMNIEPCLLKDIAAA